MKISKDIETTVINQASQYGFKARYLIGIVIQESAGNWDATRFESDYKWLWDVNKGCPFKEPTKTIKKTTAIGGSGYAPADIEGIVEPPQLPRGFKGLSGITTDEEEWHGQKTSWGPMQVMGAVAREYGYCGEFEDLCGMTGIIYGVRHFVSLYRRFFKEHGIEGVISAYNAGTPSDHNRHYVANVKKYAGEYENSRR